MIAPAPVHCFSITSNEIGCNEQIKKHCCFSLQYPIFFFLSYKQDSHALHSA